MNEKLLPFEQSRYERQWAGTGRLRSIVALTHPTAVLIFGLAVTSMAILAQHGVGSLTVLLLLTFSMGFAQAAIGVFNEVCDFDIDRISKPWRGLPAGCISINRARLVVLGLCAAAFGLAAWLSVWSMMLLALGIGMGFLYSGLLKRSALSWLPYVIAYPLPVVWVWVSLGKFETSTLLIYPVAVPFAVAVHLCNQLRDFEQDRALGVGGVVQTLGRRRALILCYALLVFSPIPFLAFGLADGAGVVFLLLFAIIHWWLVLAVVRKGAQSSPKDLRTLFRRLQLSGLLLLLGWCAITSGLLAAN